MLYDRSLKGCLRWERAILLGFKSDVYDFEWKAPYSFCSVNRPFRCSPIFLGNPAKDIQCRTSPTTRFYLMSAVCYRSTGFRRELGDRRLPLPLSPSSFPPALCPLTCSITEPIHHPRSCCHHERWSSSLFEDGRNIFHSSHTPLRSRQPSHSHRTRAIRRPPQRQLGSTSGLLSSRVDASVFSLGARAPSAGLPFGSFRKPSHLGGTEVLPRGTKESQLTQILLDSTNPAARSFSTPLISPYLAVPAHVTTYPHIRLHAKRTFSGFRILNSSSKSQSSVVARTLSLALPNPSRGSLATSIRCSLSKQASTATNST